MSLFGGIELPGHPSPENIRKLDTLIVKQISLMSRKGIAIDIPLLNELSSTLAVRMADLRKDIVQHIPPDKLDAFASDGDAISFNVESPQQLGELLFNHLGVGRGKRLKTTKSGDRISTGKKQLETLKRDHPVIPLILQYRECSKLKSTYTDALPLLAKTHNRGDCRICGFHHSEDHPRIHTSILTTRTDTGRLACVAPWTPIDTPNGKVPIKSIEIGQLVWTHKQRWRPVTAKWIKGIAPMYSVRFSTGDILTCTGDHRLLICVHEHLEKLDTRTEEHRRGTETIPHPGITNSTANSNSDGYDLSQCSPRPDPLHAASGVQGIIEDSLLALETGREESNVRQDRGPASQLDWDSGRWIRVSDLLEEWQEAVCPSYSNGGIFRTEGVAGNLRCASYRRGYEEQQIGQPSSSHQTRTSADSLSYAQGYCYCRIEEINLAGSFEVHDITVEEDESYLACSTYSHNSKKPNLQNIPARTKLGREVRKAFIAEKGKLLVGYDYAQIELRLLAHAAQEQNMLRIFQAGGDIHLDTAMRAFEISDPAKVDKMLHRAPCKNVNFGVAYGLGPPGLYDLMAVTYAVAEVPLPGWLDVDWCEKFIQKWFDLYPSAKEYFDLQHYRARRYGITWCMFGGVRLIPEVRSVHERVVQAGLRQAGNNPIQRGAAGVFKLGMARTQALFDRLEADHQIRVDPLLPIHDELIVECDEDWADAVGVWQGHEMAEALRDMETGEYCCRVPIGVDGKTSERWEK